MTSIYGSLFPVPGMGVMPTLINKLNATKTLRPILLILHALCQEALCVSAMAQIPNSIDAFKVLNDSILISALLYCSAVPGRECHLRHCRRGPLSRLHPRLLRVDGVGD